MRKIKRAYSGEKRQAKAQKTKKAILDCARMLFAERGFDSVTIEDIAIGAGVSIPTVYGLFQSKSGILKAIMDTAFEQHDYELLVQKLEAETSMPKRLALTAALSRQLYDAEKEQMVLFRDVSILNPTFKRLEMEREERRFKRQALSFERFGEKKSLGGLNSSKGRDVLWAFTGRDLYRMLVIERGWSSDEYEAWLAHMLVQLLSESESSAVDE